MDRIINLPNSKQNEDILAYRATVIIPSVITIVCTILDLVSKAKIAYIDIWDWKYICDTVNSYFFPSILATALGMMWVHYFGTGFSGIKTGYAIRFSGCTGVLLVVYIISLFFVDTTWGSVLFSVVLLLYLLVVVRVFMDYNVLRGAGLQRSNVDINRVSGRRMDDE